MTWPKPQGHGWVTAFSSTLSPVKVMEEPTHRTQNVRKPKNRVHCRSAQPPQASHRYSDPAKTPPHPPIHLLKEWDAGTGIDPGGPPTMARWSHCAVRSGRDSGIRRRETTIPSALTGAKTYGRPAWPAIKHAEQEPTRVNLFHLARQDQSAKGRQHTAQRKTG